MHRQNNESSYALCINTLQYISADFIWIQSEQYIWEKFKGQFSQINIFSRLLQPHTDLF